MNFRHWLYRAGWFQERPTLEDELPGASSTLAPTHWSIAEPCRLMGAPAGYLQELPAALAGINLQYRL